MHWMRFISLRQNTRCCLFLKKSKSCIIKIMSCWSSKTTKTWSYDTETWYFTFFFFSWFWVISGNFISLLPVLKTCFYNLSWKVFLRVLSHGCHLHLLVSTYPPHKLHSHLIILNNYTFIYWCIDTVEVILSDWRNTENLKKCLITWSSKHKI